ncbi:DUF2017 domain-containing protein [Propionibacteriaceae bacterium Y1700]|uniref:DUF2017 domain-containing protein n=1 Tax=Microlunatus sp. Y1700 TaxID=3418487 RepID=UPI003DA7557E
MKRFTRRRGLITSTLDEFEAGLLASLTTQLIELLDDGRPETEPTPSDDNDPFALWARDLEVDPDEPELSDDPVLQRLFPNAYPHDPEASSDFRRFTGREMRDTKIELAMIVREDVLQTDQGKVPLTVADDHVDAWLKTLTALRLSLAARLGIDDDESADEMAALPEDDPRAFMSTIYDWLGFAQESLIGALGE